LRLKTGHRIGTNQRIERGPAWSASNSSVNAEKRLASLPAHRVFERVISPWDETKLAHSDVEQLHLHLARSGVRSEAED
jgi:hypothetical protein